MNRRGFVLVFILLIVAVLVLYVLEFHYDSQVEIQLAEYRLQQLQGSLAAQSALNFVTAALNADLDKNVDHLGENWAMTSYYAPYLSIVYPGVAVNISIEDESGKLNVNRLFARETDGKKGSDKALKFDTWLDERLRTLGDNLLRDSAFVDAIIDFIDSDEREYYPPAASRSGGAEDSYYQKQKVPYRTKSRQLDNLDELILIKGIDEAAYFGGGGEESPGLRDLLTIYSDGKININTAPAQVLGTLHPAINELVVQKVVERRQEEPFVSVESFLALLRENGVTPEKKDGLTPALSVKSSGTFRVRIMVNYQGIKTNTEAVLLRAQNTTDIIYCQVKL